METVTVPDWVVHFVAIVIMSLIAAYVRGLVKSVDLKIAPLAQDVSYLKRLGRWASNCLTFLSVKTGHEIPREPPE